MTDAATPGREAHQVRMCVVCRGRFAQRDLMRLRISPDGNVVVMLRVIDQSPDTYRMVFEGCCFDEHGFSRAVARKGAGTWHGRSAYVHNTLGCVSKLRDEKRWRGVLRSCLTTVVGQAANQVLKQRIDDFVNAYTKYEVSKV